jgi:hypothetical protein
MQNALAVQEDEVLVALAEVGVTREELEDAIREGERARASCHPYDPPTYPGSASHAHRIRKLSSVLVPEPRSWARVNDHAMPFIVRPDHKVAITTCRGNEDVANPKGKPRSRFKKGQTAVALTTQNRKNLQLEIPGMEFGKLAREGSLTRLPPGATVHYLLVDRRGDKVFAELSVPTEIDKDGYVVAFRPRIILGALSVGELPPNTPDDDEGDDDDLDISVSPVDGG